MTSSTLPSSPAPPPVRPQPFAPRHYFGELFDPATYRHLLYHALSLPLALLYFAVFCVGFSLGAGLAVILVGLFILAGLLWLLLACTDLERVLGTALLDVNLSRHRRLRPDGLWDWTRRVLSDVGTYKAALYLLLKLPFSLLVLLVGGSLFTTALVLLSTPFWGVSGLNSEWLLVELNDQTYRMTAWSLAALTLGGLALLVLTVGALNLLARAWAFVSVALLTDDGEGEQAQREVQALRQGASTLAQRAGRTSSDPAAALSELLSQGVRATAAQGAVLLQAGQVAAEHGLPPEVTAAFAALRPALPLALSDRQAHLLRGWQPPGTLQAAALGTLVSLPVDLPATQTRPPAGPDEAAELHAFYPRGKEPSRRELEFWGAVTDQVAVAQETARLLQQARLQGSEQERSRLARDLHDSVAQALYGIALGTRAARAQLSRDPTRASEHLEYAVQLADGAASEMKALLFALRPDALEEGGLTAALARLSEMLTLRYHLKSTLDAPLEPTLNAEQKGALYRIAQEAVHNAVKHAQAGTVALRLHREERGWQLQIQDDGRGFDPGSVRGGTLGLKSMCERATEMGASFELHSVPEGGTTVSVSLPATRIASGTLPDVAPLLLNQDTDLPAQTPQEQP
ncbi:sensor histidine kinase (plasmid) [Deinococcus sp. KNUC1210]|uniref:sensor histidine kinase n=1 Tax=Deinococcus sp. KNUC1210 TaxID=2917691 RepID=UPI001EF142EF|nr:sensor histidine kinase [Deinococcus sp. KNUC1210]ULH18326.1 sensor histidine kinase [Deinococcus sp. KNUC1210]